MTADQQARAALHTTAALLARVRQTLTERTTNGRDIDGHQVAVRRYAGLEARLKAAQALVATAEPDTAALFAAQTALDTLHTLERHGADVGLAPGVGTDAALTALGDVEAGLAEADALFHDGDRVGETEGIGGRELEHVERNALRRFGADAGKSSEFVDEVLDGTGVNAHGRSGPSSIAMVSTMSASPPNPANPPSAPRSIEPIEACWS